MKAIQSALRLNELLGFVHLCHSALPEPSRLILPVNATSAAWRFNHPYLQISIPARGSPHSSFISIQEISRFV